MGEEGILNQASLSMKVRWDGSRTMACVHDFFFGMMMMGGLNTGKKKRGVLERIEMSRMRCWFFSFILG